MSTNTAEKLDIAQTSADVLIRLQDNVESVFRGKTEVVRLTIASVLARGHLLLEDVPGVGKTTLALAIARSIGADFSRIQFTSDLLPGDILGVTVWSPQSNEFEFTPGPIFSNVVLADEINRTTPRTQSALLEAMSERQVSIENVTHDLADPFLVIATQNPEEHHGTYPLPESQLDRFLMRLSIGYPDKAIEREILSSRGAEQPVMSLEPVMTPDEFIGLQAAASGVHIEASIVDYIMEVVEKTRRHDRIRIGVSTRGALALVAACKALALVNGRDFVVSDDARALLVPVLSHRLGLGGAMGADRETAEALIEDIAAEIAIPT